jgi:hypothetical protein
MCGGEVDDMRAVRFAFFLALLMAIPFAARGDATTASTLDVIAAATDAIVKSLVVIERRLEDPVDGWQLAHAEETTQLVRGLDELIKLRYAQGNLRTLIQRFAETREDAVWDEIRKKISDNSEVVKTIGDRLGRFRGLSIGDNETYRALVDLIKARLNIYESLGFYGKPTSDTEINSLLSVSNNFEQLSKISESIEDRITTYLHQPNRPIGTWQSIAAATFAVIFISTILVLAFRFPRPTPFQYTVSRIVLALASAGFATVISGFIEVTIPDFLKVGGALAVFAIVYFYSPAELAVRKKKV